MAPGSFSESSNRCAMPLLSPNSWPPLQHQDWVVYAKPPFGGPAHVLDYLGRYTHRVAISNQRLIALQDSQVSFAWTDYRDSLKKVMTVPAEEFIRLFLQHSLPTGFQRIRYYGFLANCRGTLWVGHPTRTLPETPGHSLFGPAAQTHRLP